MNWGEGIVGVGDSAEGGSAKGLSEGRERLRGLGGHDITLVQNQREEEEGEGC